MPTRRCAWLSDASESWIEVIQALDQLEQVPVPDRCTPKAVRTGCLSNLAPLTELLLFDGSLQLNRGSATKGRMAQAYADLMAAFWRGGSAFGVERPLAVKAVMGRAARQFQGYQQQDAQEALRFLVDALHEDLSRVRGKKPYRELGESPQQSDAEVADDWWAYDRSRNDSPIRDLFCGQLKSTVKCRKCGHEARAFDSFWDLSLPIPRSAQASRFSFRGGGGGGGGTCGLGDCLSAFVKPERIRDSYRCAECKAQDVEKCLRLYRLPQVLVLHLKRFSFTTFRRSKISVSVDFPVAGMSLHEFGEGPAAAPATYHLTGVVNHMGGMGGGHYTAEALNPQTGHWYNFNDSRVRRSSARSISGSAGYLLFYVRDD